MEMKKTVSVLLCMLVLNGCASLQEIPVIEYPAGREAFGRAGLVVNDGYVYSSGTYVSRTHLEIRDELATSGHFSSIELNSVYIPLQIRVTLTAKPQGSEAESYAKLLVGAATLFLVPLPQNYDYFGEFRVECRGIEHGKWNYQQPITQTQFLFTSPDSGETKVINSFVSRFMHDWIDSGILKDGCK